MSKKIPKTLQELNLVDRFLFDEAMEIPRVYETVVGILLERKLRFLDEVQTEKEFLDFMEYITDSTDEVAAKSDSERIHFIHRSVQAIRQAEQMGVKYMQKWEERVYDRLEGREEGRAEGHSCGTAVTSVKYVESLMKNLNISLEEACAAVEVTTAQYQEFCELVKQQGS